MEQLEKLGQSRESHRKEFYTEPTEAIAATFLMNLHFVSKNIIHPIKELEDILEWKKEWGNLETFLLKNDYSKWQKWQDKKSVGFILKETPTDVIKDSVVETKTPKKKEILEVVKMKKGGDAMANKRFFDRNSREDIDFVPNRLYSISFVLGLYNTEELPLENPSGQIVFQNPDSVWKKSGRNLLLLSAPKLVKRIDEQFGKRNRPMIIKTPTPAVEKRGSPSAKKSLPALPPKKETFPDLGEFNLEKKEIQFLTDLFNEYEDRVFTIGKIRKTYDLYFPDIIPSQTLVELARQGFIIMLPEGEYKLSEKAIKMMQKKILDRIKQ